MPRYMHLALKGLALLLATQAAALPTPVDELIRLMKRDPPKALPKKASAGELKWQPAMDL